MFCSLWLLSLIFLRWWPRHVNKDECILLVDIQHSQPHISLYWKFIFLSCDGNMLCKFESLIMMLSFACLASSSLLYSGGIKILLCISLTNTFNKNFRTNCGPACTYIYKLMSLLAIEDRTTWECRRIYFKRSF